MCAKNKTMVPYSSAVNTTRAVGHALSLRINVIHKTSSYPIMVC